LCTENDFQLWIQLRRRKQNAKPVGIDAQRMNVAHADDDSAEALKTRLTVVAQELVGLDFPG